MSDFFIIRSSKYGDDGDQLAVWLSLKQGRFYVFPCKTPRDRKQAKIDAIESLIEDLKRYKGKIQNE